MATPPNNTQSSGIPGLPQPAGWDESTGQPYWLDQQGQKIYWQQMQQYIWMMQQQQRNQGSGKGPEAIAMPQMPQIYTGQVETSLESNIEQGPRSPEANPEKQADAHVEAVNNTANNQAKSGNVKSAANSYLGDSPKLTKLSTADVRSMAAFVQASKSAPSSSSNSFLGVLMEKVLRALSVNHS